MSTRSEEIQAIADRLANGATGDLDEMRECVLEALNALGGVENRIDNDIQRRFLDAPPYTVEWFGSLPGRFANKPPVWRGTHKHFATEDDARAWMRTASYSKMRIAPSTKYD